MSCAAKHVLKNISAAPCHEALVRRLPFQVHARGQRPRAGIRPYPGPRTLHPARAGASARVIFKPSHHDPLGEIEVVELRGATYFEGDIHAEAQRLATVDAARFMPYAFQNIDDYTAIE